MSCRDPVRLGMGHKACCVTRPNMQVAVGGLPGGAPGLGDSWMGVGESDCWLQLLTARRGC